MVVSRCPSPVKERGYCDCDSLALFFGRLFCRGAFGLLRINRNGMTGLEQIKCAFFRAIRHLFACCVGVISTYDAGNKPDSDGFGHDYASLKCLTAAVFISSPS